MSRRCGRPAVSYMRALVSTTVRLRGQLHGHHVRLHGSLRIGEMPPRTPPKCVHGAALHGARASGHHAAQCAPPAGALARPAARRAPGVLCDGDLPEPQPEPQLNELLAALSCGSRPHRPGAHRPARALASHPTGPQPTRRLREAGTCVCGLLGHMCAKVRTSVAGSVFSVCVCVCG